MVYLLLVAGMAAMCVAIASASGVDLAAIEGWSVVVDDNAIPAERYAAEELRDHLAVATGVELPIAAAAGEGSHFLIGAGASGLDVSDLGPEDLRIVVEDGRVAIAGGRPRGTLYGVYTFLEDYAGVRFLTADHTHVTRLEAPHVVEPVDRTYRPALSFRWSFYGENRADPAFAARLRVNTITDEERLGGKTPIGLIGHSFLRYMPSRKYGEEHPEWYALRDGKRLAPFENDSYETQPCLTNPEVFEHVKNAVLRQIERHPERGNVVVGQNDNEKYCTCDDCRAIDEREESTMGALLTFVNAIADEVAKEHPDVLVGTLSYQYTRKPPKHLKPRPNVQIQLCSIECCLMHPIDDPDCELNVEFCRDLAGWGKISERISIWNYNTIFTHYLLPCPNLRVIEPNVRYFVANGAKGVFMQAAGNAEGAELSDLRNYLMAGLLWDSTRSGQGLIDEFIDLHYAESAEPIRRFINLVHDNAAEKGVHRNCFGRAADYGIDERIVEAGLEAFEEALALAQSDEVRARVEKASICAYRAAIEPIWHVQDWTEVFPEKEDLSPEVVERMRPIVVRFLDLCEKHGVTRPWEHGTMEEARDRLGSVFGL